MRLVSRCYGHDTRHYTGCIKISLLFCYLGYEQVFVTQTKGPDCQQITKKHPVVPGIWRPPFNGVILWITSVNDSKIDHRQPRHSAVRLTEIQTVAHGILRAALYRRVTHGFGPLLNHMHGRPRSALTRSRKDDSSHGQSRKHTRRCAAY